MPTLDRASDLHLPPTSLTTPQPVLLQTSRLRRPKTTLSYLYPQPRRSSSPPERSKTLLILLQSASNPPSPEHHDAAGYFSYECGYQFENFPHIPKPSLTSPLLAWFGN